MNKKGFTLVELLVVIVILALLIIITSFTVTKILNNTKKEAFKVNAMKMIEESKDYYFSEVYSGGNNDAITYSNLDDFIDGNIEKIYNDNGYNYKIKLYLEDGKIVGYYAIDDNGKFSTTGVIPYDQIVVDEKYVDSSLVVFTDEGILDASSLDYTYYASLECKESFKEKGYISYEDFQAVGDGKFNDAYAIYYAHQCANQLNIPVNVTKGDYYISHLPNIDGSFKSIQIKTSVNFNNSHIIIDDTDLTNVERKGRVFTVANSKSLSKNITLNYSSSTKNVSEILDYIKSQGFSGSSYYVALTSKTEKNYRFDISEKTIWDSFYKSDYFKIDSNGNVLNPIRYSYNGLTGVNVYEVPEETLKIENVNITTITQRCVSDKKVGGCTSNNRGFGVFRSNVLINNFNHYLDDGNMPSMYSTGFMGIHNNTDVTIKNSNFRAHITKVKGYSGSISGTYDIGMGNNVNTTFINVGYTCNKDESIKECYVNNMISEDRWGISGGNNVRNLVVKNSMLNRLDSHQPGQNISISNSIIGVNGVHVTGEGQLSITNTSIDQAYFVVNLREDYGSTWNGNIKVDNLYFNTHYSSESEKLPRFLQLYINTPLNEELGGFGYDIYIPSLNVSNVFVDEKNLMNSRNEIYNSTYYTTYSPGIVLVRNLAAPKLTEEAKNSDMKPTFVGDMNFTNIRSMDFDSIAIRNKNSEVIAGNVANYEYIYKNSKGEVVTKTQRGLEVYHKDYYKNTSPININVDVSSVANGNGGNYTTYFKGTYYEKDDSGNLIEKSGDNAVNIVSNKTKHLYCVIDVEETIKDDWYNSDELHVTMEVPSGFTISDYGLSYSTESYDKTYNMTIPKSKKGAFNVYGFVEDDKGNVYNCIKLIKKT